MQNVKPLLLVEDDIVSATAVKRVFSNLSVPRPVIHIENSEEALKYLRDGSNKRPGLILLDLNMPGINGIDFLRIIKSDSALKSIPVVVLTISEDERDIAECFNLNVVGYMIKPHGEELFVEMLDTIGRYWSCSSLPNIQTLEDRFSFIQTIGLRK